MRRRYALVLALFLALPALGWGSARAQDGTALPRPSIAMLDVVHIMRDAKVMVGIRQQVDKLRQSYQGELKGEENSISQADRELAQQRQVLSAEAYNQKRQELQKRFVALQERARVRTIQLDEASGQAMRQVRERLEHIVQDVAKRRGANIVVQKEALAWADQSLDVTDEVLRRLDAELPAVKVVVQQPPAAKAGAKGSSSRR